jgi:outer membrane protein TolC
MTIGMLITWVSFSQDGSVDSRKDASYELLIPTLEVLIDSALANNGMLGYRVDEIEVKKANLKMKKRYWTRNFGIQGDTRYGTFDNFSSNVSGPNTVQLSSTTIQTNFGIGFYLKIPVFDVCNRKSDIKQAKAELSQAENLVKFQEDEIKETVIRYYEDLILKQRLLRIRAVNLSDAKVNLEMAQKEYTNGQIPLYQYIRISDITSGIETEFEKTKSALMTSKKLLENLTGIYIN